MAKTDTANTTLRVGDRVTLTRDIRGVPEGTSGLIKVANGLTWSRYWVQFDNGQWVGSVSSADLVREDDWEDYQVRRAEEALRPETEEKPAVAAPAADSGSGGNAASNSKVPPHLLERSRSARARKAAASAE
jgi:hypothetical protein